MKRIILALLLLLPATSYAQVMGITPLSTRAERKIATFGQTHPTDCTTLACTASHDGEQCFEQDADTLYICDGSGTPAWKAVPSTSGAGSSLVFDVTDPTYGAACDGSTNDSTAINAAITAANAAGGGVVQLPCNATCNIVTELTAKDDVTLQGCGFNSILFLDDTAADDVRMVYATGGVDNFTIRDLKLDGNAAQQGGSSTSLFLINAATADNNNILVDNVWFYDSRQHGIRAISSSQVTKNLKIVNSKFTSMASAAAGMGIILNNDCPGAIISNNYFNDIGDADTDGNCMFIAQGSDNTVIDGNVCLGFTDIGIEVWTDLYGVVVSNNTLEGTGTQSLMGISMASVTNCIVSGNSITNINRSAAVTSIELAAAYNCTVVGNTINDTTTTGIILDNAEYNTVVGNAIDSSGTGSPDAGIKLYADGTKTTSHNLVSSNTILLRPSTTSVRGIALDCNAAGATVTNNLIEGNLIVGDGSASTIGLLATDNSGVGCTGGGAQAGNAFVGNRVVGPATCFNTSIAGLRFEDNILTGCSTLHTISAFGDRPIDSRTRTWTAQDFSVAGSCATPAEVTINSGPEVYATHCTDSASDSIDWTLPALPDDYDGGTFTVEMQFIQTAADTNVLGFNVACACRGDSDAVNSTYGTAVNVDNTFTTANDIEHQGGDAAMTCNGTCVAGDTVFFRATVDATATTSTALTTAHVIGAKVGWLQ